MLLEQHKLNSVHIQRAQADFRQILLIFTQVMDGGKWSQASAAFASSK